MLVKLLPEQISRQWKLIKYSIEEALPPISYGAEDRYDRILTKLLSGEMHCWVQYNKDQSEVKAILTTTFTGDPVLGVRNLLIYSLFGFSFTKKDYSEGLLTLYRFARSNNCTRIVGYTENQDLIKLTKRLKGEATYTFVTIPVEKGE